MKERPILFSASMVRAILAARKTMTRRIVKKAVVITTDDRTGTIDGPCPYGVPGDRLIVKEAYRFPADWDEHKPADVFAGTPVWYEADGFFPALDGWGKLRPSMFMPLKCSRLTLAIKSVRVERLQEITEEDARAEGCGIELEPHQTHPYTARNGFMRVWDAINGRESWDANPWVWVVGFEVVK